MLVARRPECFLDASHTLAYNHFAASAAWCRRGRHFVMINNNTPTKVVTLLAIVWYVLEIIIKIVQLLR